MAEAMDNIPYDYLVSYKTVQCWSMNNRIIAEWGLFPSRCDWVVNVRFKGKSMTYYLHAQDAERDWKLRNQCSVGEVFLNDS